MIYEKSKAKDIQDISLPERLDHILSPRLLARIDSNAQENIQAYMTPEHISYLEEIYQRSLLVLEDKSKAQQLTTYVAADILLNGKPYSRITVDLKDEGFAQHQHLSCLPRCIQADLLVNRKFQLQTWHG